MENVLFGLAGLAIGMLMGFGVCILIIGDSIDQLRKELDVTLSAAANAQFDMCNLVSAESQRSVSRLDVILSLLKPKTKRRK